LSDARARSISSAGSYLRPWTPNSCRDRFCLLLCIDTFTLSSRVGGSLRLDPGATSCSSIGSSGSVISLVQQSCWSTLRVRLRGRRSSVMMKGKRGQRIRNFFRTLSSLRLRIDRAQALFAVSNSTPLLASVAMSLSSWCEQSDAVDQVESFISAGIFSNQSEPQCLSIMWMSRLRGDSVPITAPARTYRTPPRVPRSASRESTAGLGCSVQRRLACT
jgi:hypothetical protein